VPPLTILSISEGLSLSLLPASQSAGHIDPGERTAKKTPTMKIMVAIKRVVDYAVKIRVKSDKVRKQNHHGNHYH
jgi:hypothetical protein